MRFSVRTRNREELVDITAQVASAVAETDVRDGAALVFCRHTTAALTINENADPAVRRDLAAGLAGMVPRDAGWLHAEGNSDGHLKASLFGPDLLVPLEAGELVLGTWQGIYLCEFDGPRTREIDITVLPGVR